jgi:7-carboxy-7-deazaguanine synthase
LERGVAPEKVLLMPEGIDASAFSHVTDQVIAACKEYGFRYCDRLHIRLYGNTRGR